MLKTLVELSKRVITQAGDSTDGEEQAILENNYIENAKENNYSYIAHLHNKLNSGTILENYKTSFVLKDIASRLLQHPEVRSQYIKIKATMQNDNLSILDATIGKGFINTYIKSWNDHNKQLSGSEATINFYHRNSSLIDKVFAEDGKFASSAQEYKIKSTEVEKVNLYLSKIQISDQINQIYDSSKKQYNYAKDHRKKYNLPVKKYIEDQINQNEQDNDAVEFLAALRLNKKLDRDIGKVRLIESLNNDNKEKMGETPQDKMSLTITPQGKTFSHLIHDNTTYVNISKRLEQYGQDGKISKEQDRIRFKDVFKSIIQNGKIADGLLSDTNSISKQAIEDKLIIDTALIFGLEPQRNAAALLTNAMFFDLVDKGVYKITDLPKKMPMAMTKAVQASSYIDSICKKDFTSLLEYDYRTSKPKAKSQADILAKKDYDILYDWLVNNGFDNTIINNNINYNAQLYHCINKLISDWYGNKLTLSYLNNQDEINETLNDTTDYTEYSSADSFCSTYQSNNESLHYGDLGYETDGTNAEQQAIYIAFEYANSESSSSYSEGDLEVNLSGGDSNVCFSNAIAAF